MSSPQNYLQCHLCKGTVNSELTLLKLAFVKSPARRYLFTAFNTFQLTFKDTTEQVRPTCPGPVPHNARPTLSAENPQDTSWLGLVALTQRGTQVRTLNPDPCLLAFKALRCLLSMQKFPRKHRTFGKSHTWD